MPLCPPGLEAPAPPWAGGGQGAPASGLRFPTLGGGCKVMLPGVLGPTPPLPTCHCWASLCLALVYPKREPRKLKKKFFKGSPVFKIVVQKYNLKLRAEHSVLGGGHLLLPGSGRHCQDP